MVIPEHGQADNAPDEVIFAIDLLELEPPVCVEATGSLVMLCGYQLHCPAKQEQ